MSFALLSQHQGLKNELFFTKIRISKTKGTKLDEKGI